MKCIIVFFSQSGNTKKIAYAIQDGIKPSVEQFDINRLDKMDTEDLAAYECQQVVTTPE